MYKHSTTHRTLSRRLAALLAVLALLAAMALPVYAEALDDATQMQETVETDSNGKTDNKVETGSDDETDDKSETNEPTTPAGKEAAEDSTANADGNNASKNEDTNDNASPSTTGDSNTTAGNTVNDTLQTLPADNIDPTTDKTTMDDTPDTMDEDAKQDIVTRSADDAATDDDASIQPVDEATSNAITYPIMVYFAVPEGFNDNWSVRFNAKKGDDASSWVTKPMTLKSPEYQGRRVFGVELTESECEKGAFGTIQFQYFEAYNWKDQKILGSTSVATIANKLYDAKENKWVDYKPFDPTNHTAFSGQTMKFKNASTAELTNVVAHFYEKTDGTLADAGTCDLDTVSVGATTKPFPIPTAACSYVQFTAGDENKIISSLYNFYGQDVGTGEESFLFDETNCFCFVYTEKASNWTRGGDGRTIFYDATFSKLSLDTANAIPSIVGGDVYYYLTGPDETAQFGKMTRQSDDLYYIDGVADGYDHIIFAARSTGDNGIKPDNLAKSGESTANLEIPWANEYAFPCFYADTGDDSTYKSDAKNQRDGYWAEVNTLRNAEANKVGKTVVDVPQAKFKADSSTKYIDTTLYDYYTDWELNGNNRDTYDHNFSEDGKAQNAFSAHRNWVPFRQFDQAVSDYYLSAGAFGSSNSVRYPIYTGHFQPQELDNFKPFAELSGALNLFGFTNGRAFMAANNSALCAVNDNRKDYYDYTFQGIVADKEVNGLPIMRGTENGTNKLVEPHFNEDFLKGNNSKKAKLGDVYENVSFPFTQADVFGENVKYWAFDAADTTLYLRQDSSESDKSYFLQKSDNRTASENRVSNSDVKKENDKTTYGFFPFNETIPDNAQASNYNYGFGAKLQFKFTLTEDGKVKSDDGNKDVPIKFFFSGDDDVWVFIDGQLVLDVGGAHGKASGLLEFDASGDKNTVTAYVSSVKQGGTSDSSKGKNQQTKPVKTITYKGSGNKNETINFYAQGGTFEYDKGGTHTLTMYYMERGMWESNMAIAFNFPDHNELQVEKKVELGDVTDEEFKACFTNQKLFNFTILNQATHYGATSVDESSYQQAEPIVLSNTGNDLGRIKPRENDNNYYCKLDADPDKKNTGQVIHWYAKYNDTGSDYRNDRMGVITLNNSVDITGMDYLSFFLYASGEEGEGTLSLSNMYLQLVDSKGNVLGCSDKQSLSGTTYNQVDPVNNKWINIKLDLSRLIKAPNPNFDMTQLKEIRIGDNYQRHIYFKDFTFTANPTIQKITGFTTEQNKIPDYGSAESGELKPAVNAQFSSSVDGKTRAVDKNGQFTLQDKEVVTFSDQFRRGSYLSVTEDADAALFETTWTIYENGVPVTSMTKGNTVTNATQIPAVVKQPGCTPNDGRTENKGTDNNNSYTGTKKPENAQTIVFRSYSSPDSGENGSLAKLKLQFVNKVKTGSLTIKKEAAADEKELIDGNHDYTFKVTFTDVGGLGLESKPIEKTVTIHGTSSKTISGIPVGTRFHIKETGADNGANVSKVEVTGGGKDCKVVNGKEAIGSIVEGDDKAAIATFTNTMRTLINIDLTKKWFDAAGHELTDNTLPETVYVQLQRKTEKESDLNWKPVEGTDKNYVAVNRDQRGWTHSFTNLDANDYTSQGTTKPKYQYRVVEGVLEEGEFVAKKPVTDALLLSDGYTYTYNGNEMQTTTTADGKTSNTITLINKRLDPKFALDITKKDAENVDTLLKDVEFTLEKLDENGKNVDGNFPARIGITNDKGKLMIKDADGNPTDESAFTGLEAGKYRLTETKAAKDYNLLSAPIEVEFTKTGRCLLNSSEIKVWTEENHTDFIKNGNDSYTLKLTVLNRKTPALPHTGADAPSLWLLIGLPLAVAGLLILVFRYNKKGGRTR